MMPVVKPHTAVMGLMSAEVAAGPRLSSRGNLDARGHRDRRAWLWARNSSPAPRLAVPGSALRLNANETYSRSARGRPGQATPGSRAARQSQGQRA